MEGDRVVRQISDLLIFSIKQQESFLPLDVPPTYAYFKRKTLNLLYDIMWIVTIIFQLIKLI